jgi:hypothetical protein
MQQTNRPNTPGFNPYAAGAKIYGGSRYNPTMGPVDPTGYAERDRMRKVRRNATQQMLRDRMGKGFGNPGIGRFM